MAKVKVAKKAMNLVKTKSNIAVPNSVEPDDEELITLREIGYTFDEIGRRTGMSGANARYRVLLVRPDLHKIKFISTKKRKKYTITSGLRSDPVAVADIKRRREAKETLQEIGDAWKVTRERIRQILKHEAPHLLGKKYKSKQSKPKKPAKKKKVAKSKKRIPKQLKLVAARTRLAEVSV